MGDKIETEKVQVLTFTRLLMIPEENEKVRRRIGMMQIAPERETERERD